MKTLPAVVFALLVACQACAQRAGPNILFILADDLGPGELGCYGQKRIRTDNLDGLAAEGMRFTSAYAGSCVCAPTRCTLYTGLHTGHAAIRDNRELSPEGQEPLPPDTVTIAGVLRERGYATACIGKWGLGPPGSSGDPLNQDFDRFFGYLCQRHAHNHYPTHLYRDRERIDLPGNTAGNLTGATYAPDLMRDEAERFIRENKDRPFLLFFATTVPHLALQAPDESVREYEGLDEGPYDGKKGYLPCERPRATYAAMVTRMDRDAGRLLAVIDELGLREETIVVFTSDNGPTFDIGGADSDFFQSTQGRRGRKGSLYEGGIRVPLVVRWPGRVQPGSVSDAVTATWDWFATLAEAAGAEPIPQTDGASLLPVLTGAGPPNRRGQLYWEYHAAGGLQAARLGDWKGVRRNCKKEPDGPIELYNLAEDPGETRDVAAEHPEIVARVREVMGAREASAVEPWNF